VQWKISVKPAIQTEQGTRQVESAAQNLNALSEQLKGLADRYRI
jgi:hypothetical protein